MFDLFSHIVNALGNMVCVGLLDAAGSKGLTRCVGGAAPLFLQFVAWAKVAQIKVMRLNHREVWLRVMKALP